MSPTFLALVLLMSAAESTSSASRGDALFHGREDLMGKIRGSDDDLPPDAVRCANCHEATSDKLTVGAPHLDRSVLLDSKQRRGGPPTRYDAISFCKLLRTGVDPASIIIAREMPVYAVNDSQCNSLWIFLTGRKPQ